MDFAKIIVSVLSLFILTLTISSIFQAILLSKFFNNFENIKWSEQYKFTLPFFNSKKLEKIYVKNSKDKKTFDKLMKFRFWNFLFLTPIIISPLILLMIILLG